MRGDRDRSTMSLRREVPTLYWQAIVARNVVVLQQGGDVAVVGREYPPFRYPPFKCALFQRRKQHNRTRTPPNRTRTKRFPLDEL